MKKKLIIGVTYGLLLFSAAAIGGSIGIKHREKEKHNVEYLYKVGAAEMVGKSVERGNKFHEQKVKLEEIKKEYTNINTNLPKYVNDNISEVEEEIKKEDQSGKFRG